MKIAVAVLLTSLTNNVRALQHPEAPAQHCRHDAGPPWADDEENFGNKAYFDGGPAVPKGDCPAPLAAACASKKNRRKRYDCDWVAAKARKRCKKKNKIGVRASEACECACA